MARFASKIYRWFVVTDGEDLYLLAWPEFTRDWVDAGFEVLDWFTANCQEVARVKGRSRGVQRGYVKKGYELPVFQVPQ